MYRNHSQTWTVISPYIGIIFSSITLADNMLVSLHSHVQYYCVIAECSLLTLWLSKLGSVHVSLQTGTDKYTRVKLESYLEMLS